MGARITKASASHRSTPLFARNQYPPATTTHTPSTPIPTSARLRSPANPISTAAAASISTNDKRASQRLFTGTPFPDAPGHGDQSRPP